MVVEKEEGVCFSLSIPTLDVLYCIKVLRVKLRCNTILDTIFVVGADVQRDSNRMGREL